MTVTMQPVKRTALYRTGLALGATMTDHAGWQVAARFRSPDEETQQVQDGVGLADASWLGKLEIRAGASTRRDGRSPAPPSGPWPPVTSS